MFRRHHGLTLLETLIAIALTSVLLIAVGGAGLAFMRTARDVEVSSRLQRELALSAEAIGNQLKVAARWVPVEGMTMAYDVYGVNPQTLEEAAPVRIALTGTELRVGSRVVSRSMGELSLSTGERSAVCVLELKTVPVATGFSMGEPLTVNLEVFMRNHPILYTTVELYAIVVNLETERQGQNYSISWQTADAYGNPVFTEGWLDYRRQGDSDWVSPPVVVPWDTQFSSGWLRLGNDRYEYQLRLFDGEGRRVTRGPITGTFRR